MSEVDFINNVVQAEEEAFDTALNNQFSEEENKNKVESNKTEHKADVLKETEKDVPLLKGVVSSQEKQSFRIDQEPIACCCKCSCDVAFLLAALAVTEDKFFETSKNFMLGVFMRDLFGTRSIKERFGFFFSCSTLLSLGFCFSDHSTVYYGKGSSVLAFADMRLNLGINFPFSNSTALDLFVSLGALGSARHVFLTRQEDSSSNFFDYSFPALSFSLSLKIKRVELCLTCSRITALFSQNNPISKFDETFVLGGLFGLIAIVSSC